MNNELRIIISGGGTGGHIFPAVSIANAIKAKRPDAKILFVGAKGRMEMQRVPAAGYEIKGLPICGFDRKHLLKNFAVLFRIWKSQRMAKKIIKDFKPMAAVGVGGYASGPTLNVCASKGIPCLIQEQNSYAGVTNKLLAKKAQKICVAYEGMERFFPADKIIMTGNPVRQNVLSTTLTKEEARKQFGLDPEKKTILLVGGSLGARTINESVLQNLDIIEKSGVQFIWQTGKYYHESIVNQLKDKDLPMLKVTDFISDMGGSLSSSRPCHKSCRSQQYQRVLPYRQACHLGTKPECSRRSSDQERHGTGQQGCSHLCEGCRRTGSTHQEGCRHS